MTTNKQMVPELRFKGFTDAWEQRKLGNVFDTITDYVANGSFESLRKNVNSSDINGFAYLVRLQDASNNWQGPWLYTDQHGYEFLKKSRLQPDDIIMANVGSVGKFFLVPKLDKPMTLAPNAVLIKSSENDQGFLYQMMLTPEMQHKIFEKTTPGVQSKINKTDFKMVETRLPNIEEQEKIGQFFKRLDYTITLHQRKLEKLQELKKGYLQKLFPKNGSKFPQLRFAGFTDSWEKRPIKKIATVNGGKDYKHLNKGDIPVYGTGGYMLSVDQALSEENGIGIGRKGTINSPYILRAPYWTVDTLFYVIPKGTQDLNFLYAIFQRVNWKKYDESTGVPSLSKQTINAVEVTTPTQAEQELIGTMFKQLDNLIAVNQRKVELLKKLKQAYLQKMFV